MSELDLGLKVASRRLLWRMGFSTRVDVPLRAFIPAQGTGARSRPRYETYTDLDVLGLALSPGFAMHTVIADCKTTQRGSTERMFWVRGVSDFFNADDAWMVRAGGVTAASRQLASRLGISVLEPFDVARLEEYHPTELNLEDGPLSLLFKEESVSRYIKAFTNLDRRLQPLVEYRQFDYWVYEEHRNLLQVVAHLAQVGKILDPRQPTHRALFIDCAWLYVLSLARAAQNVRAVHVTDVDTALQQYLFGGQMALQEKKNLASLLQRLAPEGSETNATDGVLPDWYPRLLELLTRHLRRPESINNELRYAEWICEAQLTKGAATLASVFDVSFDRVAAKLLADVCGFLVTMARLDPDFREFARQVTAQPESGASQQSGLRWSGLLVPIGVESENRQIVASDAIDIDRQPLPVWDENRNVIGLVRSVHRENEGWTADGVVRGLVPGDYGVIPELDHTRSHDEGPVHHITRGLLRGITLIGVSERRPSFAQARVRVSENLGFMDLSLLDRVQALHYPETR